jgi:radical SAM superfamily enzyme YgiQ (UPF0313 family)
MQVNKSKILLTTPYCKEYYDYYKENTLPNIPRITYPRINSYGLRFLKQNIPFIDIMEYPLVEEYNAIVNNNEWDSIGYSYFTSDFFTVTEMLKTIKSEKTQLWAGGYGSLIPDTSKYFNKIYEGYAEDTLKQQFNLNGKDLIHPPIIDFMGDTNYQTFSKTGILFTSRGCLYKCTYCQSPIFSEGKMPIIPLKSIERVLSYYHSVNIDTIVILDETFGLIKDHAIKVVELLHKYSMSWMAMTRTDILSKNYMHWSDMGMIGAMVGIESLKQLNIDTIKKKTNVNRSIDVINQLLKKGLMLIGFYMIGYEDDTPESIQKDIEFLSLLGLDLIQVCVLTPLHRTPLWSYIEKKYGAIDPDLNNHNMKNLVWNHPTISKKTMKELLLKSYKVLYPENHLEYARSKNSNMEVNGSSFSINKNDIITMPFFQGDHIVNIPRLSPIRLFPKV